MAVGTGPGQGVGGRSTCPENIPPGLPTAIRREGQHQSAGRAPADQRGTDRNHTERTGGAGCGACSHVPVEKGAAVFLSVCVIYDVLHFMTHVV